MKKWIKLLIIVCIFFCYITCSKKTENNSVDESVENVKSEETNLESNSINIESNNINVENLGAKKEIILELINENYDYGNGNGAIIDQVILDNKRITTRKFEDIWGLYSVDYGIRANKNNALELLEEANIGSNVVYYLPFYPTITKVSFTLFRYVESVNKSGDYFYLTTDSWLYGTTDNGEKGWLYIESGRSDPFQDGNWSILETITIQNRIWTVRKLDGWLLSNNGEIVKDNPSIDAEDLFILKGEYSEVSIKVLAITEEEDTVEGRTDHWVKIEDNQNRIGWLFGGYTGTNRGGPKYRIPDFEIAFRFAFP